MKSSHWRGETRWNADLGGDVVEPEDGGDQDHGDGGEAEQGVDADDEGDGEAPAKTSRADAVANQAKQRAQDAAAKEAAGSGCE